MDAQKAQIINTFNALNKDNMEILDGFYHPEVVFEDPLGRIEGLPALKAYYKGLYKNVQAIRFDFTGHLSEGDTHVAVWTMHMVAPGLNRGREVVLDGNSVLRFGEEGLVAYHRDYFDVGAMVYEHVPVVGFLVRQVKSRLQQH